jgi:hypothetical protein
MAEMSMTYGDSDPADRCRHQRSIRGREDAGDEGAVRPTVLSSTVTPGGQGITMVHVIRGIHRQYKREARLLRPEELGCHACLVEGLS